MSVIEISTQPIGSSQGVISQGVYSQGFISQGVMSQGVINQGVSIRSVLRVFLTGIAACIFYFLVLLRRLQNCLVSRLLPGVVRWMKHRLPSA